MIKKFIKIQNVGKLFDCNATGDVELRKMNIVYGENGAGKTTICAILKSLGTGNHDIIIGRKSLKATNPPNIEILHDGGTHKFKGNIWDAIKGNMVIFDSSFIAENVHAGNVVGHNQKTALHSYVIGEEGVRLSKEVQECKEKISTLTAQQPKTEKAIREGLQRAVKTYMDGLKLDGNAEVMWTSFNKKTIGDLIAINNKPDVNITLETKCSHIKSLEKANEIRFKSWLQDVSLPELGLDLFIEILGTSLDDISINAELLIKNHITECLNERGEQWLLYGVKQIKNGMCPFCKQSLDGIDLIKKYQEYFNERYTYFKTLVSARLEDMKARVDSQKLLLIQRNINENTALIEYWSQHVQCKPSLPENIFDTIQVAWNALAKCVSTAIERKLNNLLDKVEVNDDFKNAIQGIESAQKLLTEYMLQSQKYNKMITEKKRKVEGGEISNEVAEAIMLLVQKYRHEKPVAGLCDEYINVSNQLKALNKLKDETKARLDNVTKETLSKYQDGINRYLGSIGADFSITEKVSIFKGKAAEASVEYKIKIGEVSIPLGNADTSENTPSFKNTLSEGDKSTLAFAFFVAKLDVDDAIADKIIVLDDPINSLDLHRKNITIDKIARIADSAKQVILLTHDLVFAKDVYDRFNQSIVRCLEVKKRGLSSVMLEWDIETATKTTYYRSYLNLEQYIKDNSGDTLAVARSIRPVLEGHLRHCFPTHFRENTSLGVVISKIRESQDGSVVFNLKGSALEELESINNYSKDFHHEGFDATSISSTELTTYAKKTINFLGR